jgi:hypothetical protein
MNTASKTATQPLNLAAAAAKTVSTVASAAAAAVETASNVASAAGAAATATNAAAAAVGAGASAAAAAVLGSDKAAMKDGKGTSKLKLDMPKEKPSIKFDGDNQWQTDQAKKDLHLNQRDLFANLLGKVRDSGHPDTKGFEEMIIGKQEAFNAAENKGDYKECKQIHKAMQDLSQKILGALDGEG